MDVELEIFLQVHRERQAKIYNAVVTENVRLNSLIDAEAIRAKVVDITKTNQRTVQRVLDTSKSIEEAARKLKCTPSTLWRWRKTLKIPKLSKPLAMGLINGS